MRSTKEIISTPEFSLSVFLLAKEIPLLGIQPTTDPRKSLFIFEKTKNISHLIENFWAGIEQIEPLKLLDAQRNLKRLLHSDSYKYIQKGGLPNSGKDHHEQTTTGSST